MVSRRTKLQLAILTKLSEGPVGSLSSLAECINAHRTSVSRAIHTLKEQELVCQDGKRRVWQISEAGRREAARRQSAWGKVKVNWCGTFAVGFDCLCGEEDLQATDEEPTVCDQCGREYRMGVWFTVEGPT